jgi:hypothetical protein
MKRAYILVASRSARTAAGPEENANAEQKTDPRRDRGQPTLAAFYQALGDLQERCAIGQQAAEAEPYLIYVSLSQRVRHNYPRLHHRARAFDIFR